MVKDYKYRIADRRLSSFLIFVAILNPSGTMFMPFRGSTNIKVYMVQELKIPIFGGFQLKFA